MRLLIDIGNTRIKWAQLVANDIGEQHAMAHAAWTLNDAVAAFSAMPRPDRVVVGNVAGERMQALVSDVAEHCWGLRPDFIQSTASACGVRNAYVEPHKLGVDRWLAMIGAFSLYDGALCVVSVGTAATIDGIDASGKHLGGLIVPGPDLMVDSLLKNTSEIARRAHNGSVDKGVFANNTLGAIRQGALHALAALIERSVRTLEEQLHTPATLILSGGASAEVTSLIGVPTTVSSDLVLRGLSVIARELE